MILVIDNYDSFVHTLARYLREAGAQTVVLRHDEGSAAAWLARAPTGVVLSPGPRAPASAGFCLDFLALAPPTLPVLGVCLGSQALGEAFGLRTVRARRPMHGEASPVRHDGRGVFAGLPSPLTVGRYHSLVTEEPPPQGPLEVAARSVEGEVMALRRRDAPWHGVQFHPESLLSEGGREIVANFLKETRG